MAKKARRQCQTTHTGTVFGRFRESRRRQAASERSQRHRAAVAPTSAVLLPRSQANRRRPNRRRIGGDRDRAETNNSYHVLTADEETVPNTGQPGTEARRGLSEQPAMRMVQMAVLGSDAL